MEYYRASYKRHVDEGVDSSRAQRFHAYAAAFSKQYDAFYHLPKDHREKLLEVEKSGEYKHNWERFQRGYGGVGKMLKTNEVVDKALKAAAWAGINRGDRKLYWGIDT